MMLMWFAFAVLAAFSLTAAAYDWKLRRIPNVLCLAVAACGLAFAAAQAANWGEIGSHALHMIIALLGGMLLFRLRALGGGDAKFYAGVAAWFPSRFGAALLVDTSLAGLVLFLCWALTRRAMGIPLRPSKPDTFDRFPYGLAIGAGALLTLWWETAVVGG